eukprot:gene23262-27899_t
MIVMGVESSCDETGVGIVRWNGDGTCELLADEVASSVDQHARYGGVVPEVASRAHLEAIVPTMRRALAAADLGKPIVELGTTVDDAAGEAFDKVARLLGLGFPGGPALDAAAQEGDRNAIAFPRGMTGPRDSRHDFSFSGLKTSVARYVESKERAGETFSIPDIAASFQEAVADVLTMKAVRAAKDVGVDTLVLGGGATANSRIRSLAEQRCAEAGITLRIPKPRLCTDNGVMIASLAAHLIGNGAGPSELTS